MSTVFAIEKSSLDAMQDLAMFTLIVITVSLQLKLLNAMNPMYFNNVFHLFNDILMRLLQHIEGQL